MQAIVGEISVPKLIGQMVVKVRFRRTAGARLWVAIQVMKLAGRIAGFSSVDIETDDAKALSA